MEDEYIKKVGLSDISLAEHSQINRLEYIDSISNGLMLGLNNNFGISEMYDIVLRLIPLSADFSISSTPIFRRRVNCLVAFTKCLRKAKNNLERLTEFLDESFNLQNGTTRQPETPRKKKLREEKQRIEGQYRTSLGLLKRLKMSMDKLELWNREQEIWHDAEKEEIVGEHTLEVGDLERKLEMAELEAVEKEKKLEDVGKELTTYKKRVAGLKSKISTTIKGSTPDHHNTGYVSMCRQTELSDIRKDLVLVVGETNMDLFEGIKYYGMCAKKKLASGVTDTFAKVTSLQPNSSSCPRTLRDRAKPTFDILGVLSGGGFSDDIERHILAVKLLKNNAPFFHKAVADARIMEERKISVTDATSIKALARLSVNKIRDLRVCLNKLGHNFWPSESKMRNAESVETRHVVGESIVESGLMALKRMATSEHTEM